MASRYLHERVLVNEYLGKSKVVRAATIQELDLKTADQERAWNEQTEKKRAREDAQGKKKAEGEYQAQRKALAEQQTEEARTTIDSYNHLLEAALSADNHLDWATLRDTRKYPGFTFPQKRPQAAPPIQAPPFRFDEAAPLLPSVQAKCNVPPRRDLVERFMPSMRRKREQLETYARHRWQTEVAAVEARRAKAQEAYEVVERQCKRQNETAHMEYTAKLAKWEADKCAAKAQHQKAKDKFMKAQPASNTGIDEFRKSFETGEMLAIIRYVEIVLGRSNYPEEVTGTCEVNYEPTSGTVVVSYKLPNPADLPRALEYRYIASRDEFTCTEMKPKEHDTFYDNVLEQIVLRTIYEVLESTEMIDFEMKDGTLDAQTVSHVQSVVFNGWVHGIDPKTGQDFDSCVISCQASRKEFEQINLARVEPKECLRNLRALHAGPLAQLAPVRPILDIKTTDARFVESREVLADIGSSDNLAEMDWEDFEHLVRELFGRMFCSDGADVRVTQASRDGGVDAIAFDPDPIRGGKFVIQAKRYNNVVPVAAVRDLYGTMINEGAVKGILVTTSHYGNDSREFAKDKPITLIDGANLSYLFKQHGYDVRIDLKRASAQ